MRAAPGETAYQDDESGKISASQYHCLAGPASASFSCSAQHRDVRSRDGVAIPYPI